MPEATPAEQTDVKEVVMDEPHAFCFDCRRPYGDEHGFPDLVLPHDVWARISPTHNEGGLLCPSCICKRLHDAGIVTRGEFRSGPLAQAAEIERLSRELEEARAALREIVLRTSPYQGDESWPLVSGVHAIARAALSPKTEIEPGKDGAT